MQNKLKLFLGLFTGFVLCVNAVYAVDTEEELEDLSASGIENYDVNGSIFQQITDLEQEKVLMQLEKERAQLDLELDKLAAEKIKLHMEIDTLSGRADQEKQELENQRAKLETETLKLEQERENLMNRQEETDVIIEKPKVTNRVANTYSGDGIASRYKLVNIMGIGSELQATLSDLVTGQTKKVTVGKTIGDFTVKAISLDDGVSFEKDGEIQNLNVSGR